jgi:hypothetical protein
MKLKIEKLSSQCWPGFDPRPWLVGLTQPLNRMAGPCHRHGVARAPANHRAQHARGGAMDAGGSGDEV